MEKVVRHYGNSDYVANEVGDITLRNPLAELVLDFGDGDTLTLDVRSHTYQRPDHAVVTEYAVWRTGPDGEEERVGTVLPEPGMDYGSKAHGFEAAVALMKSTAAAVGC